MLPWRLSYARCVIRTVVFDGDQTLWDFETARQEALTIVCDEIIRATGASSVEVSPARLQQLWQEINAEHTGWRFEAMRRESFRRLLLDIEVRDAPLADTFTDCYFSARFSHCQVYPDVVPCLSELRRSYRVVLLSNGNTYPDRLGIGHLFDGVFFAQDIGFGKPDRRAFGHVQDALDTPANEMLNIGDSLENDVWGALNVGWNALWLNRDELAYPNVEPAVAMLANLGSLPSHEVLSAN